MRAPLLKIFLHQLVVLHICRKCPSGVTAVSDNRKGLRLFQLAEELYQRYHLVRPQDEPDNQLRLLRTELRANSELCTHQAKYHEFVNLKSYQTGWRFVYENANLKAVWSEQRKCFLQKWNLCLDTTAPAKKCTSTDTSTDVFANGQADGAYEVFGLYPNVRVVNAVAKYAPKESHSDGAEILRLVENVFFVVQEQVSWRVFLQSDNVVDGAPSVEKQEETSTQIKTSVVNVMSTLVFVRDKYWNARLTRLEGLIQSHAFGTADVKTNLNAFVGILKQIFAAGTATEQDSNSQLETSMCSVGWAAQLTSLYSNFDQMVVKGAGASFVGLGNLYRDFERHAVLQEALLGVSSFFLTTAVYVSFLKLECAFLQENAATAGTTAVFDSDIIPYVQQVQQMVDSYATAKLGSATEDAVIGPAAARIRECYRVRLAHLSGVLGTWVQKIGIVTEDAEWFENSMEDLMTLDFCRHLFGALGGGTASILLDTVSDSPSATAALPTGGGAARVGMQFAFGLGESAVTVTNLFQANNKALDIAISSPAKELRAKKPAKADSFVDISLYESCPALADIIGKSTIAGMATGSGTRGKWHHDNWEWLGENAFDYCDLGYFEGWNRDWAKDINTLCKNANTWCASSDPAKCDYGRLYRNALESLDFGLWDWINDHWHRIVKGVGHNFTVARGNMRFAHHQNPNPGWHFYSLPEHPASYACKNHTPISYDPTAENGCGMPDSFRADCQAEPGCYVKPFTKPGWPSPPENEEGTHAYLVQHAWYCRDAQNNARAATCEAAPPGKYADSQLGLVDCPEVGAHVRYDHWGAASSDEACKSKHVTTSRHYCENPADCASAKVLEPGWYSDNCMNEKFRCTYTGKAAALWRFTSNSESGTEDGCALGWVFAAGAVVKDEMLGLGTTSGGGGRRQLGLEAEAAGAAPVLGKNEGESSLNPDTKSSSEKTSSASGGLSTKVARKTSAAAGGSRSTTRVNAVLPPPEDSRRGAASATKNTTTRRLAWTSNGQQPASLCGKGALYTPDHRWPNPIPNYYEQGKTTDHAELNLISPYPRLSPPPCNYYFTKYRTAFDVITRREDWPGYNHREMDYFQLDGFLKNMYTPGAHLSGSLYSGTGFFFDGLEDDADGADEQAAGRFGCYTNAEGEEICKCGFGPDCWLTDLVSSPFLALTMNPDQPDADFKLGVLPTAQCGGEWRTYHRKNTNSMWTGAFDCDYVSYEKAGCESCECYQCDFSFANVHTDAFALSAGEALPFASTTPICTPNTCGSPQNEMQRDRRLPPAPSTPHPTWYIEWNQRCLATETGAPDVMWFYETMKNKHKVVEKMHKNCGKLKQHTPQPVKKDLKAPSLMAADLAAEKKAESFSPIVATADQGTDFHLKDLPFSVELYFKLVSFQSFPAVDASVTSCGGVATDADLKVLPLAGQFPNWFVGLVKFGDKFRVALYHKELSLSTTKKDSIYCSELFSLEPDPGGSVDVSHWQLLTLVAKPTLSSTVELQVYVNKVFVCCHVAFPKRTSANWPQAALAPNSRNPSSDFHRDASSGQLVAAQKTWSDAVGQYLNVYHVGPVNYELLNGDVGASTASLFAASAYAVDPNFALPYWPLSQLAALQTPASSFRLLVDEVRLFPNYELPRASFGLSELLQDGQCNTGSLFDALSSSGSTSSGVTSLPHKTGLDAVLFGESKTVTGVCAGASKAYFDASSLQTLNGVAKCADNYESLSRYPNTCVQECGSLPGGLEYLRSSDTSKCDCPPGFFEVWRTSKIQLTFSGTLNNVTVYATNVDTVLFTSNGQVTGDPYYTIELKDSTTNLPSTKEVPLIVLRTDGSATKLARLEIATSADTFEHVPAYENFEFADPNLPGTMPLRYLHHRQTASYVGNNEALSCAQCPNSGFNVGESLGSVSPREDLTKCKCKASDARNLIGKCVTKMTHLGPPVLTPSARFQALDTEIVFTRPAAWDGIESPWLIKILYTLNGAEPDCDASGTSGATQFEWDGVLNKVKVLERADLVVKYSLCHPLFQKRVDAKTYTGKGLLAKPSVFFDGVGKEPGDLANHHFDLNVTVSLLSTDALPVGGASSAGQHNDYGRLWYWFAGDPAAKTQYTAPFVLTNAAQTLVVQTIGKDAGMQEQYDPSVELSFSVRVNQQPAFHLGFGWNAGTKASLKRVHFVTPSSGGTTTTSDDSWSSPEAHEKYFFRCGLAQTEARFTLTVPGDFSLATDTVEYVVEQVKTDTLLPNSADFRYASSLLWQQLNLPNAVAETAVVTSEKLRIQAANLGKTIDFTLYLPAYAADFPNGENFSLRAYWRLTKAGFVAVGNGQAPLRLDVLQHRKTKADLLVAFQPQYDVSASDLWNAMWARTATAETKQVLGTQPYLATLSAPPSGLSASEVRFFFVADRVGSADASGSAAVDAAFLQASLAFLWRDAGFFLQLASSDSGLAPSADMFERKFTLVSGNDYDASVRQNVFDSCGYTLRTATDVNNFKLAKKFCEYESGDQIALHADDVLFVFGYDLQQTQLVSEPRMFQIPRQPTFPQASPISAYTWTQYPTTRVVLDNNVEQRAFASPADLKHFQFSVADPAVASGQTFRRKYCLVAVYFSVYDFLTTNTNAGDKVRLCETTGSEGESSANANTNSPFAIQSVGGATDVLESTASGTTNFHYESTGWQDYNDVLVDVDLSQLKLYGSMNFNLTVYTSTKSASAWEPAEFTITRRGRRLVSATLRGTETESGPKPSEREDRRILAAAVEDPPALRSADGLAALSEQPEGDGFDDDEEDETLPLAVVEEQPPRFLTSASSEHSTHLFSVPYEESVVFVSQKAPKPAVSPYGAPLNLLFGIPEHDTLKAGQAAAALGVALPKPTIYWSLQNAVSGADSEAWYRVSQSSVAASNLFQLLVPTTFFDSSISGKLPTVEYDSSQLCKIQKIEEKIANLTKVPGHAFAASGAGGSLSATKVVCFWTQMKGLFKSDRVCLDIATTAVQLHLSMNFRSHESALDRLFFSKNFFRYHPGFISAQSDTSAAGLPGRAAAASENANDLGESAFFFYDVVRFAIQGNFSRVESVPLHVFLVADYKSAQPAASGVASDALSSRHAVTQVNVHLREMAHQSVLAQPASGFAQSRQSVLVASSDLSTSDTIVLEDSAAADAGVDVDAFVENGGTGTAANLDHASILASADAASATTMQPHAFTTRLAQVVRPFATCAKQENFLVAEPRRFSLYVSAPGFIEDPLRYFQFAMLGHSRPILPSIDGGEQEAAVVGSLSATHVSAPNDRLDLFFPSGNDKVYFYVRSVQKLSESMSLEHANADTAANSTAPAASTSTTAAPMDASTASASPCRSHLSNNLITIVEADAATTSCANFRAEIFRTLQEPAPALRGYFEESPGASITSLAEGSVHDLPPAAESGAQASSSSTTATTTEAALPPGVVMNSTDCFGSQKICRVARHTKFKFAEGYSYELCFLRWTSTLVPSLVSAAEVRVNRPPVRKVLKMKMKFAYQSSSAAVNVTDVNAGIHAVLNSPKTYGSIETRVSEKVRSLYNIPGDYIAKFALSAGSVVLELHVRMKSADYDRAEADHSGTSSSTSSWLEQTLFEDLKQQVLFPAIQTDYFDAAGLALSLSDITAELVVLDASDPLVVNEPRVQLQQTTTTTAAPAASPLSSQSDGSGLGPGAIAAITIVPTFFVIAILLLAWKKGWIARKRDEDEDDADFLPPPRVSRKYTDADIEIVQEEDSVFLMRKWYHLLMEVDQPLLKTCVFCSQCPEDLACSEALSLYRSGRMGAGAGRGDIAFDEAGNPLQQDFNMEEPPATLGGELLRLGTYGRVDAPSAGNTLHLLNAALGGGGSFGFDGAGVGNKFPGAGSLTLSQGGGREEDNYELGQDQDGRYPTLLGGADGVIGGDGSQALVSRKQSANQAPPRLHLAVFVSRSNPDVRITCCNYCVKLVNDIFRANESDPDEWRKLAEVDIAPDNIQKLVDDLTQGDSMAEAPENMPPAPATAAIEDANAHGWWPWLASGWKPAAPPSTVNIPAAAQQEQRKPAALSDAPMATGSPTSELYLSQQAPVQRKEEQTVAPPRPARESQNAFAALAEVGSETVADGEVDGSRNKSEAASALPSPAEGGGKLPSPIVVDMNSPTSPVNNKTSALTSPTSPTADGLGAGEDVVVSSEKKRRKLKKKLRKTGVGENIYADSGAVGSAESATSDGGGTSAGKDGADASSPAPGRGRKKSKGAADGGTGRKMSIRKKSVDPGTGGKTEGNRRSASGLRLSGGSAEGTAENESSKKKKKPKKK